MPHFPTSPQWTRAGRATAEPRVAIIMRTKDRPLLLGRALASVAAQTDGRWHLHLVNDGGAAGPVDALVATIFAGGLHRVSVVHNPQSLGMEAATNVALARASGDYLALLDDDDTWHPDYLAETVRFLEDEANSRYVAVTVRSVLVQEHIEGDRVVEDRREDWMWLPSVDLAHIVSRNCILNNAVLTRMEAVRQIGTYNPFLPVLGDWDFALRLLAVGDIGALDRRLSFYHQRPRADARYGNSVTAGLDTHKLYDILYRNSLLRTALKDPATLGLLHVLLRMMDEHKTGLARQMVEHDTAILARIEEGKNVLARQMVEHDTLLLKRLEEGLARLESALPPARTDMARRLYA